MIIHRQLRLTTFEKKQKASLPTSMQILTKLPEQDVNSVALIVICLICLKNSFILSFYVIIILSVLGKYA